MRAWTVILPRTRMYMYGWMYSLSRMCSDRRSGAGVGAGSAAAPDVAQGLVEGGGAALDEGNRGFQLLSKQARPVDCCGCRRCMAFGLRARAGWTATLYCCCTATVFAGN